MLCENHPWPVQKASGWKVEDLSSDSETLCLLRL